MQGAVIVVDLEGAVRVVNRAALELLGYGKADLLGKDLRAVLPLPAAMDDVVPAGGRAAFREMVWQGRDGQRHEVSVSASQLADDRDGTPLGTVYVAHDITERKQAEERLRSYSAELRTANKKLEGLDKLKSGFVSTVSHELRTPLTSIKAFVELILLKPSMSSERTRKLLRIINDESDRLGRLISELLDLSRIEAGTMTWRSELVSLNDVIQSSVDGILPLARNKGLHLTTKIEKSLPSVNGTRDRLVQVVTNLLSIAVKFTPEGGTITIEAHQEAGSCPQLVVAVSDSGAGILAEDIELIFDKFHRSSNELTARTEGTGLGLTIVRQIIEHHGGRIWAASTYGAGSTFSFTIPLNRPCPPAADASRPEGGTT
jgi:PAS domain S-box-containing protein